MNNLKIFENEQFGEIRTIIDENIPNTTISNYLIKKLKINLTVQETWTII